MKPAEPSPLDRARARHAAILELSDPQAPIAPDIDLAIQHIDLFPREGRPSDPNKAKGADSSEFNARDSEAALKVG